MVAVVRNEIAVRDVAGPVSPGTLH